MSEKTTCPYCGGEYSKNYIKRHMETCKMKPESIEKLYIETSTEESTDVTISTDGVEYTLTVEPEIPEHPCPYLVIIAGNACSSCRGISCVAAKDKKISNETYCKEEWPDCLIYEKAIADGVRPNCPYFGFPPEGKTACRGLWCYAKDYGLGGVIKSVKRCRQWPHCGRYLESKSAGVPFHRKKVT